MSEPVSEWAEKKGMDKRKLMEFLDEKSFFEDLEEMAE